MPLADAQYPTLSDSHGMIIREQHIETEFIEKLKDLKYVYRPEITNRAALEKNFREKFEALNRVRLTDSEFARLLEEIVPPDAFTAAKTMRSINAFTRDDGTPLNYTLVNIKDWCKNEFEAMETSTSAHVTLDEGELELPDILTDLQDRTHLTRRSIHRVLVESGRLDDFKRNPQQFIELTAEVINRAKRMALVDGIRYQRIGAEEFYVQELFETRELSGYLKSMVAAEKSVHEHVIYQSDTERTFAEQLEKNEAIKVYAKLPSWFQVPTPLGPYNPDWAVLVDKEGMERLYFVVETKSSLFIDDLRDKESAKIKCGEAHFAELATHNSPAARFVKATTLDDVLAIS